MATLTPWLSTKYAYAPTSIENCESLICSLASSSITRRRNRTWWRYSRLWFRSQRISAAGSLLRHSPPRQAATLQKPHALHRTCSSGSGHHGPEAAHRQQALPREFPPIAHGMIGRLVARTHFQVQPNQIAATTDSIRAKFSAKPNLSATPAMGGMSQLPLTTLIGCPQNARTT